MDDAGAFYAAMLDVVAADAAEVVARNQSPMKRVFAGADEENALDRVFTNAVTGRRCGAIEVRKRADVLEVSLQDEAKRCFIDRFFFFLEGEMSSAH